MRLKTAKCGKPDSHVNGCWQGITKKKTASEGSFNPQKTVIDATSNLTALIQALRAPECNPVTSFHLALVIHG